MNWYKKIASAPKTLDYRLNNNYVRANISFQEDGYWFEDVFQNIPISKIEYNPWSSIRLKDNLEKIKGTKSTYPIVAYFDEEKDKYLLTDGNHRVSASKELGYTHVPAIVTMKRMTAPPQAEGVERLRMEQIGWQLGLKIKQYNPVDAIDTNGTTEQIIQVNITSYNVDKDYKYTIFAKVIAKDLLECELEPSGERFRDSLDNIARQVASRIVGINN